MPRQLSLAGQLIPVMSPRARMRDCVTQGDHLPFQGWVKFVPKFQPRWNLGIADWNLGI